MVWNDLVDRLQSAGLNPVEEIYIDNYGNTLPLDRPEFRGRYFRCARGVIRCGDLRIEAFLFPSENHLQDFIMINSKDSKIKKILLLQRIVPFYPKFSCHRFRI